MAEYINRESLIKRFCERCNEEMSESPCEPSDCFAKEVIKTIPAADVAPVRHGRWEFVKKVGVTNIYKCSLCGRIEFTNESPFYNVKEKMKELYPYCNCGAKMGLEE